MSKYKTKNYMSLFGIILTLIGLSIILKDLMFFNVLWEVLIIVWGVLNFRNKDYLYSAVLLVFGIVFLIDTIFNMGIRDIITGLFISAIGVRILFQELAE